MFTRLAGRPMYWGGGGVVVLAAVTVGIWLSVMTPDSRTDLISRTANASSLRVHVLSLGPSNAYLLEGDDGMILVDAGLPGYAETILDKLAELGRTDLRLIYITHAHVDHYGSAAAVRRATGVPIAVHAADAADLASGDTTLGSLRGLEWLEQPVLPIVERIAQVEATPADIILEDGDRLDDYGVAAQVVHTPGHTPGSTTLLVDNDIAFAGDLVSMTGDPHVQRSYATDWQRLGDSLERLKELNPLLSYAGHGDRPMRNEELQNLAGEQP